MDVTIRISGRCGEGVVMAGEILTLASARSGLEVFSIKDYPSEMRGGLCNFQARIGDEPILSHGDRPNVLLAFNEQAYLEHSEGVERGGLLIYDEDLFLPQEGDGLRPLGLALSSIAQRGINFLPGRNVVAVGVLAGLLALDYEEVQQALRQALHRKVEEVISKNLQALEAGFQQGRSLAAQAPLPQPQPRHTGERLVLTGNQAIALGAIVAGCRFFAGYPITPATEIMEWLAAQLPRVGGSLVQAEDEISALAMVLGASYAGTKAMTATSGPGLSLMTELLGLASMAEIPAVIVDVQRAGPSTGLPTKTEQSDLNHLLYGGHGEAPRMVIAPTSVEDAFYQTIQAFNLAEEYQVPVFLVSDQHLSQRTQTIPQPDLSHIRVVERTRAAGPPEGPGKDAHYQRYELTPSGISPIAVPGSPYGLYVATGLEHDPAGHPSYEPEMHRAMTAKRFRKMLQAARALDGALGYGPEEADIGILGWGSTEGAVREALRRAEEEGLKVAALFPRVLNPLPDRAIAEFIAQVKRVIVPEVNYTGQFAQLLRAKYGLEAVRLNKSEGLPFTPEEIYQKVKEVAEDDTVRHYPKEPAGLQKRS